MKDAEAMAKRAAKRPPSSWDGVKPLPFLWQLTSKGKLFDNITSYNVDTNNFTIGIKEYNQPFLVRRIN